MCGTGCTQKSLFRVLNEKQASLEIRAAELSERERHMVELFNAQVDTPHFGPPCTPVIVSLNLSEGGGAAEELHI